MNESPIIHVAAETVRPGDRLLYPRAYVLGVAPVENNRRRDYVRIAIDAAGGRYDVPADHVVAIVRGDGPRVAPKPLARNRRTVPAHRAADTAGTLAPIEIRT